jgi:small subunit ribosomal protein S18
MASKRKTTRRKRPIKKLSESCPFCEENKEPDYKDYKKLSKYLSDRAKIYGKEKSGLCTKHQRRLAVQIKRARHLGLLPYVSEV